MQTAAPLLSLYFPAWHEVQLTAPEFELYLPTELSKQGHSFIMDCISSSDNQYIGLYACRTMYQLDIRFHHHHLSLRSKVLVDANVEETPSIESIAITSY